MRILMLGAGGIGGYFGGRLAEAGADVTFLVRDRRAAQLAAGGLVVKSPTGDIAVPVKTVTRATATPGYDAILLSCKSYDLEDAIESVAGAAPGALIVPLLNGLLHLARLDEAFGPAAVAGGLAQISATLDADGTVRHLAPSHGLVFGERQPAQAARCAALAAAMVGAKFDCRHSADIMQDMWQKFVFLCSLAAITTLMRAPVGAIAATQEGKSLALEMLAECETAALQAGHPSPEPYQAFCRNALTMDGSKTAASMLRDLQGGHAVEAAHIVGDMLARARVGGSRAPLLRAAYSALQIYEASRAH